MVHVLRLHAGYRCRHAGVCCTEDWAIPVEAPVYRRLAAALASSALQPEHAGATYFVEAEGLASDASMVTGRVGCDCAFFEPGRGRLCAIHRQLGHAHLPSACQHFPRVVAIDPRGIFVSLSHVCPTAGRLLRDPPHRPFDVVHDGPVVVPGLAWAGLDAREALPPQVNAQVLWDWEALTMWERGSLELLGEADPERAVSILRQAARTLEGWRPRGGETLAGATAAALETARQVPVDRAVDVDGLHALARRAAPHGPEAAGIPGGREHADRELVAPSWPALAPMVCRYLASRTLANAAAYHAACAGVLAACLDTAYAVLRAEAARLAAGLDRRLDEDLLVAAAAAADRLLVHRVDAGRLAASLQTALRS